MATHKTFLVISAVGADHPGLVNDLSRSILEYGCNIEDSRMTVLGGEFAAILLVEGKWNTLAKVENALPELAALARPHPRLQAHRRARSARG